MSALSSSPSAVFSDALPAPALKSTGTLSAARRARTPPTIGAGSLGAAFAAAAYATIAPS
ncbi:MAG: hypothetical protein U0414_40500 [Polyangiaceae bacterium]